MKLEQAQWINGTWKPASYGSWKPASYGKWRQAQLVLLFGAPSLLRQRTPYLELKQTYPDAHILGCSTAGEIVGAQVCDGSLVATAIHFEHTTVHGLRLKLTEGMSSHDAGEILSKHLDKRGLVHVFVISNGVSVNGSALVTGLTKYLPSDVTVTGGLAGDGDRFQETLVLWESEPESKSIVVIGFYSNRLRVGCASLGGWDAVGPRRLITRSQENVLYELDNRPALSLYKTYLGEHAQGLPATGLLFPLHLLTSDRTEPVVRTILSVDEKAQSITFAGDVPQGTYVRFMRANFDRLIGGAVGAAKVCSEMTDTAPDLAILISCVGRKLVLKDRIGEEVLGVRGVLGSEPVFTGFYSYGEISPFTPGAECKLHNQTMTITTFSE
jgi:hypothetical protein